MDKHNNKKGKELNKSRNCNKSNNLDVFKNYKCDGQLAFNTDGEIYEEKLDIDKM